MEFIFLILLAAQGVSFVYFRNKIKKLEKNENITVTDDFDKIKQTSSFTRDIWHRIYGDK